MIVPVKVHSTETVVNDGLYIQQFQVALTIVEPPPKPKRSVLPYDPRYCSCIEFVKDALGITESLGTPRRILQGKTSIKLDPVFRPVAGRAVILDEGPVLHVAIMDKVDPYLGRFLTDETNYERCKRTQRWIYYDDPRVLASF